MSSWSRAKPKNKKGGSSSSKARGHTNSVPRTFYAFENTSVSSAHEVTVAKGRFSNIDDDAEEVSGTQLSGTGLEYDSVSNSESLSGGSEEHREKPAQLPPAPSPRPEPIPGAEADDDKREKMRQKNERKHQRQKEKRAQELSERCNGYLMLWKLELLAQQLVGMGFPQERARVALIANEGKVEESALWLLDAKEEERERYHDLDDGASLKIDISAELARISDMAVKYNVTRQEVQRALVSCEGNIDKAEEIISGQKEEPDAVTTKPEEAQVSVGQNSLRVQARPNPDIVQQRTDEKGLVRTRNQAILGSSADMGPKSVQVLRRTQPPNKPEGPKPQQQWRPTAGSSQAGSLSSASPLQVPPHSSQPEPRYRPLTSELRNLEIGSVKGPVVRQRPPKAASVSRQAATTAASRGPYLKPVGPPKPIGVIQRPPALTKSLSPSTAVSSSNPTQQFGQPSISNGGVIGQGVTSPPVISFGRYTGMKPNIGSSSSLFQTDWSTGSSTDFDYRDVDWSLNSGPVTPTPGGLWNLTPYTVPQDQTRSYELFGSGGSLAKSDVMRPPVAASGNEGLGSIRGVAGVGSIGGWQGSGGVAGLGSTGPLQGRGGAPGLRPNGGLQDSGGAAGLGSIGPLQGRGGAPGLRSNGGLQDSGGASGLGSIGPLQGRGGASGLGPISPLQRSGGKAGLSSIGPLKGSGGAASLGSIGPLKGRGGVAGLGGPLKGSGGPAGLGSIGPLKGNGGVSGLGSIGPLRNSGGAAGLGGPLKGSGGPAGLGSIGPLKGNGGVSGLGGPLKGSGGPAGLGSIGPLEGNGGVSGLGSIGPLQNNGGVSSGVLQEGGADEGGLFRDWTSPFEGRDLFSIPRQFVFSP